MTALPSVQHLSSPWPSGPPPAAVWNRPQSPVWAGDSSRSRAAPAWPAGASPTSIGVALIQWPCSSAWSGVVQTLRTRLAPVAGVAERVGVEAFGGEPPARVEALLDRLGLGERPLGGHGVAAARRHLGERSERLPRVGGHVELLGAHPGALDHPVALRPQVGVGVEGGGDMVHAVDDEVVHLVAEGVVTTPAPDQRDGVGELGRLVRVPRVVVGAEVDRAIGDHLVHDLAGGAVDDPRDVADRAQVCSAVSHCPEATRG